MDSNKLILTIIGHNTALTAISRNIGVKLAKNDLLMVYQVLTFNQAGVKCGIKHLDEFCRDNGFTRDRGRIAGDLTRLVTAGLVTIYKPKAWYSLLQITVTIQGKQVLNDFNKLLSSYKVKGLPVV